MVDIEVKVILRHFAPSKYVLISLMKSLFIKTSLF